MASATLLGAHTLLSIFLQLQKPVLMAEDLAGACPSQVALLEYCQDWGAYARQRRLLRVDL
jgi:hypothetical protein